MKTILLLISFLFLGEAKAILIDDVFVNCEKGEICDFFRANSKILKRKFRDKKDFFNVMKIYFSRNGYNQFSFKLKKYKKDYYLFINLKPQSLLTDIEIEVMNEDVSTSLLYDVLEVREGDYIDDQTIDSDRRRIVKKLGLLGYPNSLVVSKKVLNEDTSISLKYQVSIRKVLKMTRMRFQCDGFFAAQLKTRYFQNVIGKPLNREYIIQESKELNEALVGSGYYLANVQYRIEEDREGATVFIDCGNLTRIVVEFDDENLFYKKKDIYRELRDYLVATKKVLTANDLRRIVEGLFIKKGFKGPEIAVREKIKKSNEESIVRISVKVKEVGRIKVRKISFKGNSFFNLKELEDFYEDNSSDLASGNYVDEEYYKLFVEVLREKYIEKGYIKSQIAYFIKPYSVNNEKEILFVIREGVRTAVSKLSVVELHNKKVPQSAIDVFDISEGDYFNPIKLEKKLKEFSEILREDGYFFASIKNNIDSDIVEYTNAANEVEIKILIDIGQRFVVNDILVYGLEKTKESVVRRKLQHVKGQYYTPTIEKDVYSKLASLGIFRSYNVHYLKGEVSKQEMDLLINVREKDYGVVEIAPGYRTDLGLKLSGKISRINLKGLNQGVSITGQTNYRLSLDDIDGERTGLSEFDRRMIEYSIKFNYLNPDIFKTYWDYFASVSVARKRFFAFDADIFRVSNTFRKEITDYFSFSLNHQLERIEQFNASPRDDGVNDNGKFTIGTLTPSIAFDFRDNPVLPRKGTYFQLSYEMAKPEFLSQDKADLKIDFYKLVFRNKSYIPVSDNFYIATSVATGIQENEATEIVRNSDGDLQAQGFIPSIKVFRLTGVDTVRGFAEDEINVISDSDGELKDISDIAIRNKAFMTNFKFEPRYMVTDNFIVGAFLDAGRVQANDYDPFDLRTAAGISLKYVTPVGTLDLDYGHKLDRTDRITGGSESPGRIHLSIGFF